MKKILALFCVLFLTTSLRADDYIVILLDTSGSMQEHMLMRNSRLDVAKSALIDVLATMPPTTKIGLLTFTGWQIDLGSKDNVRDSILACRAGGGTPLYQFMKIGADKLLEEREKNGNIGFYKLLVVTDGEASDKRLNEDSDTKYGFTYGVLKDIINRGIVVDVIGLAMTKDHSLKNQINGFYMKGDDPKNLKRGLNRAIAEVGINGNDGVSNETFKEVAELPVDFARASIQGLSEFQNYPIGTVVASEYANNSSKWLFISIAILALVIFILFLLFLIFVVK